MTNTTKGKRERPKEQEEKKIIYFSAIHTSHPALRLRLLLSLHVSRPSSRDLYTLTICTRSPLPSSIHLSINPSMCTHAHPPTHTYMNKTDEKQMKSVKMKKRRLPPLPPSRFHHRRKRTRIS